MTFDFLLLSLRSPMEQQRLWNPLPTEGKNMICRYCGKEVHEAEGYVTHGIVGEEDEHSHHSCFGAVRIGVYEHTGVVDNRVLSLAMLSPKLAWSKLLLERMDPVHELVKRWEREVWFNGEEPHKDLDRVVPWGHDKSSFQYKEPKRPPVGSLQEFVFSAEYKGYKATVGTVQYLSYTICGRSVFVIEDMETGYSVSIILDEDSPHPRGGLQYIYASVETAIKLLEQAIKDWKEGLIKLVRQDSVGFGI